MGEQLTLLNIILFILGFLTNILLAAQRAREADKDFKFFDWLEATWITALLSLVSGFALLIMGPDIMKSLDVPLLPQDANLYKFYAFLICGLSPLVVLRVLMATKNITGDMLKKKKS